MSSSSSDHYWIYDVFINFRGEDTRNNFVSHLYASLANAGINTFIDDKIPKGNHLSDELKRAIRGSQIALLVFSKTYTQSIWCLRELQEIMSCHKNYGQVVVPIFYDVDPSEVRHQKGAFGEALEPIEDPFYILWASSTMSGWRRNLTEAANLSGWDIKNYRSEAEQVTQIVKDVLNKLDLKLLDIADFPVGLESRVQEIIRFIQNQSSLVCKIGIWGMGGLGKTTIAKAIYNRLQSRFKNRSFIENVRELCEKDNRGRINFQEQLLADILNTNVTVRSIASGTAMIKRRLKWRKMLIVFDDVNKLEQLKSLCLNASWIGSGSVIIITSRDVSILRSLQVDYIYEMEGMNDAESLELFNWHAFGEARPRDDFSELSINVVGYCGGLPLALEVLGSYLNGRNKQEWTGVLSKLERIPNEQVLEKLKISYDSLDDMEKQIFLDICCFFIGKDRTYVTDILNGCGFYPEIGIAILVERSLIKVGKNNKLRMHDLLCGMGREIVRQSSPKEPNERSRLWANDDALHVLTEHNGTNVIEGLTLKLQRTSELCFDTKAFENMKRLRLLQLEHVQLAGDYGYLPKHLSWVCWKGFPLKYIPNNFYQGNVVAINLKESNINLVWKEEAQLMVKLKVLNLSHSKHLTSTPDFSNLPNLEKLILKDCPRLTNIHQSIGDLSSLHVMNLKDCTSLSNLPREIYQLKSLETLILSGCSKIDKLEEELVNMESLTTLIAKGTNIKETPRSIVRLKSIGYISLCEYEGLASDVFPSLIWSWMSPNESYACIPSFGSLPSSLVSMNVQDNIFGDKSPIIGSLSKLRCLWVQCKTEIQLSKALKSIMNDTYSDANVSDLATSYASTSQILEHPSRSLLIGMGSHCQVLDALRERRSKGLTANGSTDFFLPNDNFRYCISHTGEGNSVLFKVPHISDWFMKGMVLSVVYSWTTVKTVDNCLISIFIVNHTKCTIQIYKQDTAKSFNDEDWQGILSNLGLDDKVQICVAFGHGLTVKWTTVYQIYDTSVNMEKEPLSNPKKKLREDL